LVSTLLYLSTPPPTLFLSPFSFNTPPTTAIYTLSLHDALPISRAGANGSADIHDGHRERLARALRLFAPAHTSAGRRKGEEPERSEEHTSELQSRFDLVCRLLLEKKKKTKKQHAQQKHNLTTIT